MRRTGVLVLISAVLLAVSAPCAAGAPTGFGISDSSIDAFANSTSFHTFCGWNGSACGNSALRLTYARVQVPYNALGTYDAATGTCVSTADDANNWMYHLGAPEPMSAILHDSLAAATRDGLRPLVSLQWGNPNLTGEPDNPSRPTADGYRCGIAALMQATAPGGPDAEVHEWEPFNEPDSGLCASTAVGFLLTATQVAAAAGRAADTFVAGTFKDGDDPLDAGNHPDCGHGSGNWFIRDYVSFVQALRLNPAVWSWHPYTDVDAGYNGPVSPRQTQDLDAFLNRQFPSHPAFWLTEAGANLNNPIYGQFLDGSPIGQADAAAGFRRLAAAPNQAYPGQIARTYWYQYQTYGDGINQGSDRWDSALLGLTDTDWGRSGSGIPRPSYCVLAFGDPPWVAVRDRRCDQPSGPQVPWTDWEDPAGG